MIDSSTKNYLSKIRILSKKLSKLSFESAPYVYNPYDYAWSMHKAYVERFGATKKISLFLGMNPGPWGMAQTGIPFGEVNVVANWMELDEKIAQPKKMHEKRVIEGLQCQRSEVSGRRLWGYFSRLYPKAEKFFSNNFVLNYCPLLFLEQSAKNKTPDKLLAIEREEIATICDEMLYISIKHLNPNNLIGVGAYAEKCFKRVVKKYDINNVRVFKVLHPSPASPMANKGWEEYVVKQIKDYKIKL